MNKPTNNEGIVSYVMGMVGAWIGLSLYTGEVVPLADMVIIWTVGFFFVGLLGILIYHGIQWIMEWAKKAQ